MPVALQPLQAVRLMTLIQSLQDQREIPQDLRFLRRLPLIPAADDEIMARFTGHVMIADLVADDATALTYSNGKFTFESTAVPNIKLGINLTQSQINQLLAIAANGTIGRDQVGISSMASWENRTIESLLLGVRQRMNALACAMLIDGFSYDRLGIKMNGVTWGMPSDLKVTPAVAWTNAATATPVEDMLAVKLVASVRYGQMFNRVTMSTQAFRLMIATTEFQAKARMYLAPNVSYTNLSLSDLTMQMRLAEAVLGMTIELEDSRYWTQAADGSLSSAPYLPINKVILSNSQDDNDANAMDFANGITTESVVASLAGGAVVGSFGGPQRGPIAYATVPPHLNPPTITYWGAARGFPRKHRIQATAVLTVGTLVDAIPVGAPAI